MSPVWNLLTLIFLFSTVVLSISNPEPYVLHETRHSSPEWKKLGRVEQNSTIRMRIALTQTNLDKGYDLLMNVSHPNSPNYAKYYSTEDVVSLFSPANETVQNVKEWLISSGIDEKRIAHTQNKGWFVFDAYAHEAERLLKMEYHTFQHTSGKYAVAGESYSIPKRLRDHIDFVLPGVSLISWSKPRSSFARRDVEDTALTARKVSSDNHDPLANCYRLLTPECVAAIYKIPKLNCTHPNPNNSLGIWAQDGGYDQYDLNNFYKHFAPYIPQGTHPIEKPIDGGRTFVSKSSPNIDVEVLLDFQAAYPIVYPQTITHFSTDDNQAIQYLKHNRSHAGFFNHFLDAIDGTDCTYCAYGECGDDPVEDPPYPNAGYKHKPACGIYKPTNVVSFSTAINENIYPLYYQKRQCLEFMKLGLKGVSVLFSSGDNGPECYKQPNNTKHFNPEYAASCPYVTAVGGTLLTQKGGLGLPEEMADFSGGGFSNVYARPDYQKEAVENYFAKHDPGYPYYESLNGTFGKGLYNRIGRGYPDISADGLGYPFYAGSYAGSEKKYQTAAGTSLSAPLVAGIVTRINEERLAAGKAPVGFLNPALYHHPQMLTDITKGHSTPMGSCGTNGFSAVPGWDPGTGVGTPNYPKMRDYFMSLP